MIKLLRPPKYTQRRIVWNEDGTGTAILLVGYCPPTLPYFLGLADDLLKMFPDTKPADMICGQVTRSSTVEGFTVLMAKVKGPKAKYPGWTEWPAIDFDYT